MVVGQACEALPSGALSGTLGMVYFGKRGFKPLQKLPHDWSCPGTIVHNTKRRSESC